VTAKTLTMIGSVQTRMTESASQVEPPITAGSKRFAGKLVGMVTYSAYPDDPRPRRAVDALLAEGARVELICLSGEGSPRRETLDGLDVYRVPLKHLRRGKFNYAYQYGAFILLSSAIFALRSLSRHYDLVYVHNMPDILVLSAMIPKALGARVVLDLHDPMPELMMTIFNLDKESPSVRLIRRVETWSIARANSVLTVNLAMKKLISSRSCGPEKIGVVMNSPDGRIFPLRVPTSDALVNHAADKRFAIMYHGSIVERNGLDVAVEALAKVRQSVPSAELRIFGPNTPFLERVMDIVRAKNLQDAVHYLGPRSLEGLVPEIERCDIGVIPNHRNTFTDINTPTRIFEYLALGKPVIAPSTPGIQDYFDDESLLFFEAGNPDDLARQMEFAFSHPGEMLDIARKGQKVYLDHTWECERQTLLGRLSDTLQAR
jgi:glycosyltransferase involved in cell wall biosynthesis